jgi:scyllo-inositol 2-dehydrogenase (NADP+)
MIKVAIVGLGKMGISHQAILNANPDVELAAVCDSNNYLLSILKKYTGVQTYSRLDRMLDEVELDALVVATPSRLHAPMVKAAIERGLHVFCEKPFCLDVRDGPELAALAREKQLVTQVGYHNRFVGAFAEVKRLLDAGAIGDVSHVLAEAYGPVVLKPTRGTWRSISAEGGGSLYDYAAHPINLVNWYLGAPIGAGGTVLNSVFSAEIDDEVSSTLYLKNGATAQVSVNWSDESVRKMTTRMTLWGTHGRIFADRQECQVYLRDTSPLRSAEHYRQGWNVRYTTELTNPVDFYLRGEEYSAELDYFVTRCQKHEIDGENSFESAVVTDRTIDLMIRDAHKGMPTTFDSESQPPPTSSPKRRLGKSLTAFVRRLIRR